MQTEKNGRKSRHALYLFNEMSKFKKYGILCDVVIPGKLELVSPSLLAHKRDQSSLENVIHVSSYKERFNESGDCSSSHISSPQIDSVFEIKNENKKCNGFQPKTILTESVESKLAALNDLRRHHCHCDVTFEVGMCKYYAHKMVLAACSEYFRAMFTSKMKEQEMRLILLKGVDRNYFKRVLDFIYSGELTIKNCEDGIELLKMAVFYQIPSLTELCCNSLSSCMDADVACSVLHASRELALKQLSEMAVRFIHDNFLRLDHPSSNIYLLSANDLIRVLESDCLGGICTVSSELVILRIVLRWLITNLQASSNNYLISLVRFSLIPLEDIMRACKEVLEEKNAGIGSGLKASYGQVFRKHLFNVFSYHKSLYKQPLFQGNSTSLRSLNRTWVSVDGVMTPSTVTLTSDSKFVSEKDNLENFDLIRDPFHSVIVINDFIYVIGGTRFVSEGYSSKVNRYDPRIDEWICVANMHEERGDFVAVVYDNCIYVFGGRNQKGALNSCERYDVSTNQWKYIASLPDNIYMAAGLVAKERIYITGGFNNYETVATTSCYNPLTNEWEQIFSPMMSERGYHVITYGPDGRLWVIGGVDNPFSGRNVWEVEAFDMDEKKWMYVGQIIPVKLLLSTIRLNVFRANDGYICISAVTCPDKYSTLKYDPKLSMWLETKEQIPCVKLEITS